MRGSINLTGSVGRLVGSTEENSIGAGDGKGVTFRDVGAVLVGPDVDGAAVGSDESSSGTIATASSSESDCAEERSSGGTASGAAP